VAGVAVLSERGIWLSANGCNDYNAMLAAKANGAAMLMQWHQRMASSGESLGWRLKARQYHGEMIANGVAAISIVAHNRRLAGNGMLMA